jgi:hypothetical protein
MLCTNVSCRQECVTARRRNYLNSESCGVPVQVDHLVVESQVTNIGLSFLDFAVFVGRILSIKANIWRMSLTEIWVLK